MDSPTPTSVAGGLRFRAVDRQSWPDLERLFESLGGPKYCWCMAWRATLEEAKQTDGAHRKAALKRRVDAGTPVGLLGYLGEESAAWCSIAPRTTYRPLGGLEDETPENVWSLVCMFVVRRFRGHGLAAQLIAAAIRYAQENGATIVEAYPVDADSPSYRHMGRVSTFLAAGFTEVGRVGMRRHLVRRRI
jgi:GNAT superfamily N-acetyltransferase